MLVTCQACFTRSFSLFHVRSLKKAALVTLKNRSTTQHYPGSRGLPLHRARQKDYSYYTPVNVLILYSIQPSLAPQEERFLGNRGRCHKPITEQIFA